MYEQAGMESAALRFDNYLILFFTVEEVQELDHFEIEVGEARHRPEFVYQRRVAGSDPGTIVTGFFWIQDLVFLSPNDLKGVRLYGPEDRPLLGSGTLGEFARVRDKAHRDWLELMRDAKLFDAFNCRYFPEILQYASDEDRAAYIEACVEYVDASNLTERAAAVAGEEAPYRELYYYLFRYVQRKNIDYAEASIQELFCDLSAEADWSVFETSDIVPLFGVLRSLKLGDVAVEKVINYLIDHDWARGVTAQILPYLVPEQLKWAIYSCLTNEHLGWEQISETLALCSRDFKDREQGEVAELFRRSALEVRKSHQLGMVLDYGYRLTEQGDWIGAQELFSRIDRGYSHFGVSGRVPWPLLDPEADGRALVDPTAPEDPPRVTIITPTLNQGEYIEQTLKSVLAQNYPNLQYIVVDGGSSDGTTAILERYREHIDVLISEPDDGQSHAINKGLVLADGDLVGWLNSDDLLAPGALSQLAKAYREDDSEIFAGICCEFSGDKFHTINRPSLGRYGLQRHRLGDIFGCWFSGEFFYQPEVFFSRKLVERVGLLDERHDFAMDYDLWMRFAQRQARVCVVSWPFAFFRLQDKQKIKKRAATVEEQARIRDRYIGWHPNYDRTTAIVARVERHFADDRARLHVVSSRMSKIFAADYPDELPDEIGRNCNFVQQINPRQVGSSDIVIKLIHLQNDLEEIKAIRERAPRACLVGWFWDNHHHADANFEVAEALDVVIPGHSAFESYLRNIHALQLPTLALSVTQWTRAQAAAWTEHVATCERSSRLYGGYIEYGYSDRIGFVKDIQAAMPDHNLYSIEERQLHKYFGQTPEARLEDWAAHMVSLVLPLRADVSQRVFDALLAGQIPLVPDHLTALDEVFGTDEHYDLPIVRFRYGDVESVKEAHARAVELFRSHGVAGIRRRHTAALEHHMFGARIRTILDTLSDIEAYTPGRARTHA